MLGKYITIIIYNSAESSADIEAWTVQPGAGVTVDVPDDAVSGLRD